MASTTIKMGTQPGVYIQEEVNTALGISEAKLKIAGIIGHSSPTLDVNDVQIIRGTGNTDVLPYSETAVNRIYTVSNYIGANGTNLPQYTEGIDYELSGNEIQWLTHPTSEEVTLEAATALWKSGTATEPQEGGYAYHIADVAQYPSASQVMSSSITAETWKSKTETLAVLGDYVYPVADFSAYPAENQVQITETGLADIQIGDYVKLVEGEYEPAEAGDVDAVQVVDDKATDVTTGSGYVRGAIALEGSVQVVDSLAANATGEAYVLGSSTISGSLLITARESIKPTSGDYYYVSCNIKKEGDYFEIQKFANYEAVTAFYGPEYYTVDIEGEATPVLNELVMGAKLAFANGADVVYTCQVSPDTQNLGELWLIKQAIDKFAEVDVQAIVCLAQTGTMEGDKELQRYIQTHVDTQSSLELQHERVAFVSAITEHDSISELLTYAATFRNAEGAGDQRIVVIAPARVTVEALDRNSNAVNFIVPSVYAGAAMVGRTTDNGLTVAEPLTRKTLFGIKSISSNYKRQDVEKLSAGGLLVLLDKSGAIKINQAVTTDISNQNNRELSVVLIKDQVRKDLRDLLDSYIGHFYNRKTTPTTIKSAICAYLDTKIDTLIEGYNKNDVIVLPDPDEATQINVNLKFAVLRPLNYIYLSFMVVL